MKKCVVNGNAVWAEETDMDFPGTMTCCNASSKNSKIDILAKSGRKNEIIIKIHSN